MTSANTHPTNQPDEPLLRALVHDLDAGFVRLFEAYRQLVFTVALRVCGRWADAEDLTAEAFLRAYRALSGYRPNRILALRPKSWLLTITVNLWRNEQRAAAHRPECEGWDEQTHPPQDVVADVAETVASRSADGELATLLQSLPAGQRAAIVLRHVVDLPVGEIAAVLGRPEGTVKSDISRGLRRLRELYPSPVRPLTQLTEANP